MSTLFSFAWAFVFSPPTYSSFVKNRETAEQKLDLISFTTIPEG